MMDPVRPATPPPSPQGQAIVLTFDDVGNVSMQATPGVTAADYILGAFNLQRQANRILDGSRSPIVLPGQPS